MGRSKVVHITFTFTFILVTGETFMTSLNLIQGRLGNIIQLYVQNRGEQSSGNNQQSLPRFLRNLCLFYIAVLFLYKLPQICFVMVSTIPSMPIFSFFHLCFIYPYEPYSYISLACTTSPHRSTVLHSQYIQKQKPSHLNKFLILTSPVLSVSRNHDIIKNIKHVFYSVFPWFPTVFSLILPV